MAGDSWRMNTNSVLNRLFHFIGMRPNLSLNPDASPAALARRPLGAG